MKDNVILEKSFKFSLRILRLVKYLKEEKQEYILVKQIIRSGTAIGALVSEAQYGESKNDFLHKLNIALKEAAETEYWIELLYQGEYIDQKSYDSLIVDIKELIRLLIAITKSLKSDR